MVFSRPLVFEVSVPPSKNKKKNTNPQGPGCPWCEKLHPVLQNASWVCYKNHWFSLKCWWNTWRIYHVRWNIWSIYAMEFFKTICHRNSCNLNYDAIGSDPQRADHRLPRPSSEEPTPLQVEQRLKMIRSRHCYAPLFGSSSTTRRSDAFFFMVDVEYTSQSLANKVDFSGEVTRLVFSLQTFWIICA